jgi:MFS family permease
VTAAVGTIAALVSVGVGMGIVLAGPIMDVLGWRWLFWLPLILTLIAVVGGVLFIPKSPVRSPGRVSWLSAALRCGWLVALLVALTHASGWGWGSPRVIRLLAAAAVLALAWIAAELRAATPLINMHMMRHRAIWTNNLVALLIGIALYATFAFLPEFVQTPPAARYGFGASILRSGLMLLPMAVTMLVAGLLAGPLARRVGGKALVVAGCLAACLAMAILAFAHAHQWEIYLSTAIMGTGFGLVFSAMAALVTAAVPADQTGAASGVNTNIRAIGGSIGSAVMASFVTARLEPSGLPRESGYTAGFAFLAACLVIATLAGLRVPASRRGTTEAEREFAGTLAETGNGGGQPEGIA